MESRYIACKILKGLTLLLVISNHRQAYRIRKLRLIYVDRSDTILFAEMMAYLRKPIAIS